MKHWLVFFIVAISLCGCTVPVHADSVPLFIQSDGVGEIKLGMSGQDLQSKYPRNIKKTTVMREGQEPALIYTFSNGHKLVLELTDADKVWAIRIVDPFFQTKDGIHVGYTFGQVKKAYPDSTLSHGVEEEAFLSLSERSIGGYFSFDITGISEEWLGSKNSNTLTISNQKVNMIIIQDLSL